MAQWLGQFSGNTHETKVQDSEDLLRHAVKVFRTPGNDLEHERRAKAVVRLAKRLLTARLKLAKARIAAAPDSQAGLTRASDHASLKRRYEVVCQGGVEAILREFGVQDVPPA